MNHFHFICYVFHLIALQMTDHMPFAGISQLFIFLTYFLYIVLAEQLLARRHRCLNVLHRFQLADRTYCHLRRVPVYPFAGLCHILLHGFQILCNFIRCQFKLIHLIPCSFVLPAVCSLSNGRCARIRITFHS